jgi:hypothetical protein
MQVAAHDMRAQVRPWPKATHVPRAADANNGSEGAESAPWRCYYFMGLKKKPAPLPGPGAPKGSSVNLNVPVSEFKQQVRLRLLLP